MPPLNPILVPFLKETTPSLPLLYAGITNVKKKQKRKMILMCKTE
jgi:hypothetical protein